MIYRGCFNKLFLYEVTRQDLLLQGEATSGYSSGNILIFSDKTDIALGTQIARADDLAAAREYLESSGEIAFEEARELEHIADSLESQATSLEEEVARLTKNLAQRDELLRDVSESLSIQRERSAFLAEQLQAAQGRMAADELARKEMMGDLQNVSEETHNIEVTLEQTLLEKDELEQELARSITEFVELNLQNDELQRHLDELRGQQAQKEQEELVFQQAPQGSVADERGGGGGSSGTAAHSEASVPAASDAQANAEAAGGQHIITMSSGKQIHIYHEFPQPEKRSSKAKAVLVSRTILRTVATVCVLLVVAVVASVLATAQLNNITPGEALNVLLKGLGLLS